MSWNLVYTKQAQKDAKKLASSNLRDKAQELLDLIQINPFGESATLREISGRFGRCIFTANQHSASSGVRGN